MSRTAKRDRRRQAAAERAATAPAPRHQPHDGAAAGTPAHGRWAALLRLLTAPTDIASLAVFRIGFGLLLVYQAWSYLSTGRIDRLYLMPTIRFSYPGLEWLQPLSPVGMRLLFAGLLLAGAMIAVGLLTRLAALAYTVGYGYAFLLDTSVYNNHIYLILLLTALAAALPLHRAASLDVLLRPRLRAATVPTWTLWLLRFQLGVPYFFGGIAKLNYDWMVRAQPMRLWFSDGSEGSLHLELLREPWVAYFMSWSGMLLDLLAAPALCWRRSRPWAMAAVILFHLSNAGLFVIGVFPWLMIWATFVFLPSDWPRRLHLLRPSPASPRQAPAHPDRRQLIALTLAGAWVLVQLVLPLRHYLYPGNVDWTDQAHRFSWRMKLRDKRGSLNFVAYDRKTGQSTPAPEALDLLTPHQRDMATHDPEMVRQLAVVLGDRWRGSTTRDLEIRVESSMSLNDLPPRPLIDPRVDLSRVRRDTPRREWLATLDP